MGVEFRMSNTSPKMPSSLPRVVVYLEPELKTAGEKLAAKRKRSLSNLLNVLLQDAVDDALASGELEKQGDDRHE